LLSIIIVYCPKVISIVTHNLLVQYHLESCSCVR
jgi:hypothetical protein